MAQATGRAAANMVKMAARESGMFGQRVFAPKRDMPEVRCRTMAFTHCTLVDGSDILKLGALREQMG